MMNFHKCHQAATSLAMSMGRTIPGFLIYLMQVRSLRKGRSGVARHCWARRVTCLGSFGRADRHAYSFTTTTTTLAPGNSVLVPSKQRIRAAADGRYTAFHKMRSTLASRNLPSSYALRRCGERDGLPWRTAPFGLRTPTPSPSGEVFRLVA